MCPFPPNFSTVNPKTSEKILHLGKIIKVAFKLWAISLRHIKKNCVTATKPYFNAYPTRTWPIKKKLDYLFI